MLKKIFLFYIFFIASIGITYGADCKKPSQTIRNVCLNDLCTETQSQRLSGGEKIYRLFENDFINVFDINSWVKLELENFTENLDREFIIEDFCVGKNFNDCDEKSFNLENLINHQDNFKDDGIFYYDGLDYFLKNYNNVLSEIRGYYYNYELSDIITNLISYSYDRKKDKHKLIFKNVCSRFRCTKTSEKSVFFEDTKSLFMIKGVIYSYNVPTRKEIEILQDSVLLSSTKVKAGEQIRVSFSFIDEMFGTNCESLEYKYKINYKYLNSSFSGFLDDSFKLNNDGSLIDTGNVGIFNVDNKYGDGLIKVDIKENFVMTKSGDVVFSFEFEDNFGNIEPSKIINEYYPISIIASEPNIDKSFLEISDYNDQLSYFMGANIFEAKIFLNDSLGNNFHEEDGISVQFGGDKQEYIYEGDPEILESDFLNLENNVVFISENNETFTGTIHNVKPELEIETGKYFYRVNYKFTDTGSYKKKFLIKVKKRDIYGDVIDDGFTSIYITDENKTEYNIRPVTKSDVINIRCSQVVHLKAVCTYDADSKCKNTNLLCDSEVKVSTEEIVSGFLCSSDNGGHEVSHPYIIDHVDITPPMMIFNESDTNPKILNLSNTGLTTSIKAMSVDNLKFKLIDPNLTSGCINSAEVNYKIRYDGIETQSGTIEGQFGTINVNTNIVDGKDFFEVAGTGKTLEIELLDYVGNKYIHTKEFDIYPTDKDLNTVRFSISGGGNNKFADGEEYYNFELMLKDKFNNGIYGKTIKLINQTCGIFTDSSCNTLTSKEYNNTGTDVLFEEGYKDVESNYNGIIPFSISSLVPGKFMESFIVHIDGWDKEYKNLSSVKNIVSGSNNESEFLSPISVNLTLADTNDEPKVGLLQEYVLRLLDQTPGNAFEVINFIKNGSISINNDGLMFTSPHKWNIISPIKLDFGGDISTQLGFSGSIDAIGNNALAGVTLDTEGIIVNYKIKDTNVSYKLPGSTLEGCDRSTLGLKVIGNIQGDGKGDITGQSKNFTDISKSNMRSQIRSNGYKLIKGRKNDSIVNGVKFVVGTDVTLGSGNLGFETLIVKNGNVNIEGNLDNGGKKLGIMVLKDNYLIEDDYKDEGNIYVKSDVSEINAIIYADGVFRSANANGSNYDDNELSNVLELKGSLFTRNTIGGAVTGNSSYLLPGGQKTDNYELAEIYDLNYVRKINSCNEASFIIKYDSNIQLDPPIGFSVN